MTPYERDPTGDFAFLHRPIGSRRVERRIGVALLIVAVGMLLFFFGVVLWFDFGATATGVCYGVVAVLTWTNWERRHRWATILVAATVVLLIAGFATWIVRTYDGPDSFSHRMQGFLPLVMGACHLLMPSEYLRSARRLWRGDRADGRPEEPDGLAG